MTMEPVDHWIASLEAFDARIGLIGPDDVTRPTPNPGWDVGRLVEHVVWFQRVTVGQLLERPDVDSANITDPLAEWRAASSALRAAVAADGALDQHLDIPFGDGPLRTSIMVPTVDLLFHTWDLARALGVDDTLPEATCAAVYEAMLPFDEAIRRSTGAYPDGYADKIEPPPNADIQTRLLCFAGRQQ